MLLFQAEVRYFLLKNNYPRNFVIVFLKQIKACTATVDLSGVTGDCTKFLRCIYGTFYEMSCPPGTNFDYIRKVCDFPASATCLGGTAATTTTTVSSVTTTTLAAGQSKAKIF